MQIAGVLPTAPGSCHALLGVAVPESDIADAIVWARRRATFLAAANPHRQSAHTSSLGTYRCLQHHQNHANRH
jgi:hypothetical protein